ncbi:Mediator of RNA polymerase II transcription subunit 5 [Grifola frondosa]|uniref:Mediator of RNA polymerase II transcription subunit 5 n=1 Tax=Grifola frondosa TaxID=5627 RepID=A0A1C7MR29_GRIFR|nr:Mediator of RNA polymerase II transcription subunit 5 [Grifola frondosa]
MSLSELTRNAFQSGIPAQKWINLCKLFISKHLTRTPPESIQSDINSVLILFRNYPGEPALQNYLRFAIQDGVLSLPTFVTTFLSAARSPDLHNSATLDMLCRVVLDYHYASGMPAIGSIVPYSESTIEVLGAVQDAMALLRTAHSLPMSHFHQLTTSASELLILLLSCVTDVSQISTAQAMVHFADANDMLQVLRLSPGVRQVLETFVLSLSLLLGDDAKAAREAQMMHTLQLALGKGSILGPGSESDIVTCGLLTLHQIFNRAGPFGSGDGPHIAAVLVSLLRWSSWTPVTFYTQLLAAALNCVAQNITLGTTTRSSSIWRSFVIGRVRLRNVFEIKNMSNHWRQLPHLLVLFQKAAELDSTIPADTDWRASASPKLLWGTLNFTHSRSSSFTSELLYQLLTTGLIDASFSATLNTTLNDFHPRLLLDAQDAGLELPTTQAYFEAKLSADASLEDMEALLQKAWRDPCSHAAFAEVVMKRFTSSDVESLSSLCKILCKCDIALDMLSLHAKITDVVAHALAFVEDYDCETVGDPQTAVSHLGDVVLFLQSTIVRFNLSSPKYSLGRRELNSGYLRSAALVYRVDELKGEDATGFKAWFKALFDASSEGIEDSILRATRPKTLLRIAATLFSYAISLCTERKMETDVLNNGISYFLGPLLNWTLAGVVRVLLMEVQHKGFKAPIHLEVLQTLLSSSSCPPSVLRLSATNILRLFPDPKTQEQGRTGSFDTTPIRRAALQALGLPTEESQNPLSLNGAGSHWTDQSRQLVNNALSMARAGKAPALDPRWATWRPAAHSDVRADHAPVLRRAPLLPIFLHIVLPSLVVGADHLAPTEQAISVELLVAVVSSALTAALHLEWALLATCGEERFVLGQSAIAMARRVAGDLHRRGSGPTAEVILQRLASSPQFATNFPIFADT